MNIKISGLKCDNPECDYRDDTVNFEEYESRIDSSCPDCGENLLTQEDYEKAFRTIKYVLYFNKIRNIMRWTNPKHYFRLLFGDRRKIQSIKFDYNPRSNK